MFKTHQNAELNIPAGLSEPGQRSWLWIEMTLQMEYLFLSCNELDNDDGMKWPRQFIFSSLHHLLRFIEAHKAIFQDLQVGYLSTPRMNADHQFHLESVKEIWESKRKTGHQSKIVMMDGTVFNESTGKKNANAKMKLVLSL